MAPSFFSLEDVNTAVLLNDAGIRATHSPAFRNDRKCYVGQTIVTHYADPPLMYTYWENMKNGKDMCEGIRNKREEITRTSQEQSTTTTTTTTTTTRQHHQLFNMSETAEAEMATDYSYNEPPSGVCLYQ